MILKDVEDWLEWIEVINKSGCNRVGNLEIPTFQPEGLISSMYHGCTSSQHLSFLSHFVAISPHL